MAGSAAGARGGYLYNIKTGYWYDITEGKLYGPNFYGNQYTHGQHYIRQLSGVLDIGSKALGGLALYYEFENFGNIPVSQSVVNTTAWTAGFFGPVGSSFSFGYSAGQTLDQYFNLSNSVTDGLCSATGDC